MIVISVANIKGGVGKTQTCINLSKELSEGGNVLLIDNDSQSNTTQILLNEELGTFDKTLYDVYMDKSVKLTDCLYQYSEKLFVCPNTILSSKLDRQLINTYNKETILKHKIEALPKGFFDFVIIDNTPALNITLENSLCASDYYIAIVDNSSSALQGLRMIQETVEVLKEENLTDVKLGGVLRNRFDKKANFTKAFNTVLEESLGDDLFKTIIYDSVRYKEAIALHQCIDSYNKAYAIPYKRLIKEMSKRMKGR